MTEPTTEAGRQAAAWPGLFAGETPARRLAWVARIEAEARADGRRVAFMDIAASLAAFDAMPPEMRHWTIERLRAILEPTE